MYKFTENSDIGNFSGHVHYRDARTASEKRVARSPGIKTKGMKKRKKKERRE